MTGDEYMTTAEFAQLMRVPDATVRYWRHIGKGPKGIKPGRKVLYAKTEVDAWRRQLEEPAA